jgi:transcriptional regulator with XRE-family HTH domain
MTEDLFGERMQKIADNTGGITSISKKTGISPRSIKGYIDGDNDPSRKKLIALAEAADVSIEWLVTGCGPMRPQGEVKAEKTNGEIRHLEDPLIKDIKLWLREMTSDNPGWLTWFEMELMHKIPLFKEWRQKKGTLDKGDTSAVI